MWKRKRESESESEGAEDAMRSVTLLRAAVRANGTKEQRTRAAMIIMDIKVRGCCVPSVPCLCVRVCG